jgi:Rod binding domain-containing protein
MDFSPLNSVSANLPTDLTGLAVRSAHTPAAQRQAVAGQFEAILLRQFLSQSVGSMMGGDKDTQGSIYSYFLTDTLAQKLAAGSGMGLAKVLAQQLAPKGTPVSASASAKATADGTAGKSAGLPADLSAVASAKVDALANGGNLQ